jgi:RNA polymerase sigma-70 factor (ECF subfamily)
MRRSRRSPRQDSVDARVPDPIVGAENWIGPQDEAALADSVGLALLVVLRTLTPAERLAFVLHDMFALPFDQIAPLLGRSPTATRRLTSRARRRVRGAAPAPGPDVAPPA